MRTLFEIIIWVVEWVVNNGVEAEYVSKKLRRLVMNDDGVVWTFMCSETSARWFNLCWSIPHLGVVDHFF